MKFIKYSLITLLACTHFANAQSPEIIMPEQRGQIEGVTPRSATPITPPKGLEANAAVPIQSHGDPEIEREMRRTKKEILLNNLKRTRLDSDLEIKKIEVELKRATNDEKKIDGEFSSNATPSNLNTAKTTDPKKGQDGLPVITVDRIVGVDKNLKTTLKIEGYGRVVLSVGQTVPLTDLSVRTIDGTGVTLKNKEDVVYTVPFS